MTTTVEPRAARVRCHKCGSEDVFAVCHHCGVPMCRADSPRITTTRGKPRSREFAGLGIEVPCAYHCPRCDHLVKRRLVAELALMALLVALGVALLPTSTAVGLVLLAVGVAGGAACYRLDRRRLETAQRMKPVLPLLPKVDSAAVAEKVRGRLTLDAKGEYRTSVTPTEGELSLSMTFGRTDLDRLSAYRAKYRLPGSEGVDYCAGFAVLKGEAGMRFTDPALSGSVLPLTGRTEEHPFFTTADGPARARREIRRTYGLAPQREVDDLPISLTPSLSPGSDRRTLEIEVQWDRIGPDRAPLRIEKFQPLVLLVPIAWGNVESANHRPSIGRVPDPDEPDRLVRCITWSRIALTKQVRKLGKLTLSVRFEEQILVDDVIRGRVVAFFQGTLSGLSGIDVMLPLGYRREETSRSKASTEVDATFELSLAGIRYQDTRVVPDRHKDTHRAEVEEFSGVIPDHETIARLTNALSDEGYYVKRVIENPPRSTNKAHVLNRYWDIAGRWYDGVYPIDFHLSITGEEVHGGDIRAQSGNSRVRLSVQGAYASKQMEQQIEGEWERLRTITGEAMRADPAASTGSGFDDGAGSPRARTVAEPSPRTGELHHHRAKLVTQLAEGAISETTFREVTSWIDRQLDER